MTHRNQREYDEAMARRENRQEVAKHTLGPILRAAKAIAQAEGKPISFAPPAPARMQARIDLQEMFARKARR